MRYIVYIFFIVSFSLITLTSCETYEDGGVIMRAEKNIINTWTLHKLTCDGQDWMSNVQAYLYKEQFTINNFIIRSFYFGKAEDTTQVINLTQKCEWEGDNYEYIRFYVDDEGSDNFLLYLKYMGIYTSEATIADIGNIGKVGQLELFTRSLKILALKRRELIYSFEWEDHTYVFTFKPNA